MPGAAAVQVVPCVVTAGKAWGLVALLVACEGPVVSLLWEKGRGLEGGNVGLPHDTSPCCRAHPWSVWTSVLVWKGVVCSFPLC